MPSLDPGPSRLEAIHVFVFGCSQIFIVTR